MFFFKLKKILRSSKTELELIAEFIHDLNPTWFVKIKKNQKMKKTLLSKIKTLLRINKLFVRYLLYDIN
jgi:hypothetical protein